MAEYLRNNAIDFLEEAEENIKKGKFNIAVFNLEMSLQLALRYELYQQTGSFQKTHDLKKLLSQIIDLTGNKELVEILKNESVTLDLIEQAYISARYLPVQYSKDAAQRADLTVRRILNVLGVI
ncbi:MAG: HEPN domain-containing protein [Nitrososphaeria archaeon]|jgi:HEPN domain-containing protein